MTMFPVYYMIGIDPYGRIHTDEFKDEEEAFVTFMAKKILSEKKGEQTAFKSWLFKLFSLKLNTNGAKLELRQHSPRKAWKRAYHSKEAIQRKIIALKL